VKHPSKSSPSPLTAIPICIAAVLAVSTGSIFVRLAQDHAPSLVIAAYRLTLCTLVLTPFALARGTSELKSLTRRDLGLAALAGAFLALHFATWIASLEFTSVASSVVLVCTSPLFVALLAPWFLKEPLTRRVAWGVGVTVAGGMVIGLTDTGGPPAAGAGPGGSALLGNGLALAGAAAMAGYLLVGRSLRPKVSLLTYIFLAYGFAAGMLILLLAVTGHAPFGYSGEAYLWFVLLALVPQLIGHSTFNWTLRFLPTASVAVLVLGEPVGTILLATVFLQEPPEGIQIAGAAMILAGIYLVSAVSAKKRP